MATGILGQAECTQTDEVIYEVPADTFAVVTVTFCNRATSNREIRLAVTDDENNLSTEAWKFLEFNAELLPSGVLERSGIVLDAGKKVTVMANGITVGASVYGIETTTV